MNRYQRTTVNGITYDLDLHEAIDCGIAAGGWEVPVLEAVRRYLKPGMVALDIGANVGAHALPMAKMVGAEGMVFAFEPMGYAFKKLVRNCQLNPALRVIPSNMALGDCDRQFDGFYKSSWPMDDHARQDYPCHIDMTTLDQYWLSVRNIDVIKMDVDGNEFGVLVGGQKMLQRCRPVIVAEAVAPHFSDSHTDPFQFLQYDLGYRFLDIGGGALTHDEIKRQLPAHDPEMTTSINLVAVPK